MSARAEPEGEAAKHDEGEGEGEGEAVELLDEGVKKVPPSNHAYASFLRYASSPSVAHQFTAHDPQGGAASCEGRGSGGRGNCTSGGKIRRCTYSGK
jgi:hypothetical protein